jgi:hypothetical protein
VAAAIASSRPVEALVGLDEPDAQEDEGVVRQAETPPGPGPVQGGAAHERLAVVGHLDPGRRHAERAQERLALGLGVQHQAVHRAPHGGHGRAHRRRGVAERVVDLVHPDLGAAGQPEGEREGGAGDGVGAGTARDLVEEVGVELDDEAVVGPDPLGQGQPAPWPPQVEVVVGGRRPRREHLDVVALEQQAASLLHGVGGDPVPVRRVRRHHQDAFGRWTHLHASRSSSTWSSTAGQR